MTSPLLTLGIYKCTFSHKKLGIPKENLATKSLPHLVSLSIDGNLNLNQVVQSIIQTQLQILLTYKSVKNKSCILHHLFNSI